MKKKFKLYILLLLLIAFTLTGCEKKEELVTESAYMLGTHIEISIWTDNVVNGKASIQKSFKRIEEIEKRMSVNIKESDISLLNKSAGKNSVKVNPDTAHV
ncbi:MAG: FAD:protein FMN transferase, partial [Alkaliphilus sp.]|nr:FAD:protein FMN transferase [Alkaliphilus sp.]